MSKAAERDREGVVLPSLTEEQQYADLSDQVAEWQAAETEKAHYQWALKDPEEDLTDADIPLPEPPEPNVDEFNDDEPATHVRKKKKGMTGANRQAPVRPGAFTRGDSVELAERLLKALQGKGPPLVRDDGALYRYETADGVWREVTQAQQSCTIQDFAGSSVGEKARDLKISRHDVLGAIANAADRALHAGFFTEHAPAGVAFANGFVKVTADGPEVHPHDPANRARFGFEFPFEPDAEPTMYLKFLNDVFEGDEDREQKIAFIQEFGGIAMLGLGPQYQKCLVATSSGAANGQNGKSQLAEILCGIMPTGSVSCVRPQDFENEYRRAQLSGKLLNCVGEMPEGDILDSTSFKAIITGDVIEGRHIRQSPFSYRPRAAHYYACNQPPGTSDFTRAFFRRFEFLTFNRVFREGTKDHVPDIGRKIVAAERGTIASWHLVGAARVMRQGGYTKVPSSAKEIETWRINIDQVALFLSEWTAPAEDPLPSETHPHDWISSTRLYEEYVAWAEESRHKPLASNKFALRMEQLEKPRHRNGKGRFYPVKKVKRKTSL